MRIDFIYDIGCLWSYIVWRQLRISLEECAVNADITPFFVPSDSFFAGFTVSPADKARMLEERTRPFLEETGLSVDFDLLPDFSGDASLPARLIRAAFAERKYDVLDDIFASFFTEGLDITNPEVLSPVMIRNGLKANPDATFVPFSAPAGIPEGLRAVPCLIFDKRAVLFGAQSVPCLKNMLSLSLRLQKENALLKK